MYIYLYTIKPDKIGSRYMLSITDGPLNKFLPTPALCRCLPIRGEETAEAE